MFVPSPLPSPNSLNRDLWPIDWEQCYSCCWYHLIAWLVEWEHPRGSKKGTAIKEDKYQINPRAGNASRDPISIPTHIENYSLGFD